MSLSPFAPEVTLAPALRTVWGGSPLAPTERLESLILNHVVTVREFRADSIAVVLRPDPDTEVFLHLTRRDGTIEAQLRCEPGAELRLHAQWGALQEALARHGVRLAPLNAAPTRLEAAPRPPENSPSTGGNQSDARRRPPRPAHTSLEELPMVGSLTEPLRRRPARGVTAARRGWEWWA